MAKGNSDEKGDLEPQKPRYIANEEDFSEHRVDLTNLTDALFSDLLAHFGLSLPDDVTPERAELLAILACCSTLTTTFNKREFLNLDIVFGMDKLGSNNIVLNVIHRLNDKSLYTRDCKLSPCSVCEHAVEYGYANRGQGMECFQCKKWFHNQCLTNPLSMGLYYHMEESPDNVRVFCPTCVDVVESLKDEVIAVTSVVNKSQANILGYIQSLSVELESLKTVVTEGHNCTSPHTDTVDSLTGGMNSSLDIINIKLY